MFKKLSELVESGTIDKAVAEALDTEISAELTTLRDEAKKYRVERDDMTKSFDEVKHAKEDMESKLSDFDDKIKAARLEGKSEIVKELEQEREKQNQLLDNLSKFETENKKLKITNAINEQLGKVKIKADVRSDVEMLLASGANLTDDGVIQYGDKALDEGIKEFFESRQSYLEPVGDPGSGSNNGGGGGGSPKGNFGGDKSERLKAIDEMINKG